MPCSELFEGLWYCTNHQMVPSRVQCPVCHIGSCPNITRICFHNFWFPCRRLCGGEGSSPSAVQSTPTKCTQNASELQYHLVIRRPVALGYTNRIIGDGEHRPIPPTLPPVRHAGGSWGVRAMWGRRMEAVQKPPSQPHFPVPS